MNGVSLEAVVARFKPATPPCPTIEAPAVRKSGFPLAEGSSTPGIHAVERCSGGPRRACQVRLGG